MEARYNRWQSLFTEAAKEKMGYLSEEGRNHIACVELFAPITNITYHQYDLINKILRGCLEPRELEPVILPGRWWRLGCTFSSVLAVSHLPLSAREAGEGDDDHDGTGLDDFFSSEMFTNNMCFQCRFSGIYDVLKRQWDPPPPYLTNRGFPPLPCGTALLWFEVILHLHVAFYLLCPVSEGQGWLVYEIAFEQSNAYTPMLSCSGCLYGWLGEIGRLYPQRLNSKRFSARGGLKISETWPAETPILSSCKKAKENIALKNFNLLKAIQKISELEIQCFCTSIAATISSGRETIAHHLDQSSPPPFKPE
ncbi:hypothetical protein P167DRAFT_578992 [Morchella conica CCBAS932]|uniref:Uncharacterized protein n=1 Tax=Morchella conica CCBAS932 TaxID=1392247 RepID=A0A3N4KB89_9PEZI|nr:hypothetical protein P167DRAFT_578992 [Morchella conica CCBAS932]